jgi:sporulation protein YlmC with PRC-barrel domain
MKKVRVLFTLLFVFGFILTACAPQQEGTETPLETPLTGVETEMPEATEVLPGTGLETPTEVMTEEPVESPTAVATEAATEAVTEAVTATAPAATDEVGTGLGAEANVPAQLTRLMDFEVQNANGDSLGDVNDMVVDLGAAQVTHIILGAGGFLGIGERAIPIPWNSAHVSVVDTDTNQCAFVVDVSNETLQNVPDFDPNSVDFTSPDWSTEIDDYWTNIPDAGTEPAISTPDATDADTTVTGTPGADDAGETGETTTSTADISACFITEMSGELGEATPGTPGAGDTDMAATGTPGTDGAEAEVTGTPATNGTGAEATGTPGTSGTGGTGTTAAQAEQVLLASDLLGYTINDSQGENVGHVEDAIIHLHGEAMPATGSTTSDDLESGQIAYIVMEVDAALDIADDWVLLPVEALQEGTEEGQFSLNMSMDELNSVPSFPAGELPLGISEDWDQEVRDFWADMTT